MEELGREVRTSDRYLGIICIVIIVESPWGTQSQKEREGCERTMDKT